MSPKARQLIRQQLVRVSEQSNGITCCKNEERERERETLPQKLLPRTWKSRQIKLKTHGPTSAAVKLLSSFWRTYQSSPTPASPAPAEKESLLSYSYQSAAPSTDVIMWDITHESAKLAADILPRHRHPRR